MEGGTGRPHRTGQETGGRAMGTGVKGLRAADLSALGLHAAGPPAPDLDDAAWDRAIATARAAGLEITRPDPEAVRRMSRALDELHASWTEEEYARIRQILLDRGVEDIFL